MDIYHIWADLKEGVRDTEFTADLDAFLGHLESSGLAVKHRLTRRKLGLAPETLGEFHIMIEFENLAQLDAAFKTASSRADPVEEIHHAVNAKVTNFKAALYRDFPDPHRVTGQERF